MQNKYLSIILYDNSFYSRFQHNTQIEFAPIFTTNFVFFMFVFRMDAHPLCMTINKCFRLGVCGRVVCAEYTVTSSNRKSPCLTCTLKLEAFSVEST